jgi:acyl-CoA reductase-like NAD-dependent aldehyde dehydrogenase
MLEMAVSRQTLAAPSASALIESIDPSTGGVVAQFESTNTADLPLVFEHAREAQKQWAGLPLRRRCAMMMRLKDAIFDARAEIVDAITRETGKPRTEAIFAEVLLALDTAQFLSRRAPRWLRTERVPHHNLALKAKSATLAYEPHGVIAIISPWNYPFSIPMAQVIPALLAGNSVLLKPSELTPAVGALIGELFERANFPANLLQVLQGPAEVGAAMTGAHPDKVLFTGSVATGRRIAEVCGANLIPTVLELGGKDAMIVLADADLEAASSAALWGAFTNCGQACLSVERVYVAKDIAERFIGLCVEKTKKLRLGPPSDADAEIGPMIRPVQVEKVEAQLRDAVERGAQILTGGCRRPDLGPSFFEPAVVVQVDHSMQLMRDETFGPVLPIQVVASPNDAVELANDSPFSLSASIWTRDALLGRELASRLRVGSVMINDVASYYGISEAPHGGRRASGWGRTHSRLGLLEMVQPKYVDVDRLPRMAKPWWFGYTEQVAVAADRFVELLFARSWKNRWSALKDPNGVRRVIFRRNRI